MKRTLLPPVLIMLLFLAYLAKTDNPQKLIGYSYCEDSVVSYWSHGLSFPILDTEAKPMDCSKKQPDNVLSLFSAPCKSGYKFTLGKYSQQQLNAQGQGILCDKE